mgnify:CR=1 FL=1
MKQTINNYDFHRAFETLRPNNFSYDGLNALFDWFEQLEDDTGEQIELDVIAICCDFAEMSLDEINQDYCREYENMDEAIDSLNDETMVIPVNDDALIVQSF